MLVNEEPSLIKSQKLSMHWNFCITLNGITSWLQILVRNAERSERQCAANWRVSAENASPPQLYFGLKADLVHICTSMTFQSHRIRSLQI